ELDAPVLRMLAKDPKQRPSTAGEALAELAAAAERAGHTIPPGLPHLARPVPSSEAEASGEISATLLGPLSSTEAANTERDGERAAMVRSTGDRLPKHGINWSLFAAMVALVGVGLYFVARGTESVVRPVASAATAAAAMTKPSSQASEHPSAASV